MKGATTSVMSNPGILLDSSCRRWFSSARCFCRDWQRLRAEHTSPGRLWKRTEEQLKASSHLGALDRLREYAHLPKPGTKKCNGLLARCRWLRLPELLLQPGCLTTQQPPNFLYVPRAHLQLGAREQARGGTVAQSHCPSQQLQCTGSHQMPAPKYSPLPMPHTHTVPTRHLELLSPPSHPIC